MSNNIIQRTEITPFDVLGGGDDPSILNLNSVDKIDDKAPITTTQVPPIDTIEIAEPGSKDKVQSDKTGENDKDGQGGTKTEPGKIDSQGQGEGEGDKTDDVEYDVKIKANLAKYAAQTMKAKGALPEDFEITDDITEEQLDEAYLKYKEEPLRNEIRKEELERLAAEEGLTPEMIEETKMRYFGVQDEELKKVQILDYLSTFKFDEKAESFEEEARNFLKDYYTIKELHPDQIDGVVEANLKSDKLLQILNTAQQDLGQKGQELFTNIQENVRNKQQTEREKREKKREAEINMLKSGKIGNVTLTSDMVQNAMKALYEKTEIITAPDGKRYRTTLYNKLRLEAANNPELELQQKLMIILGKDLKQQNSATEKATQKIVSRLNEFVEVDVKTNSTKGNTNEPGSRSSGGAGGNIERVAIN